MDGRNKLYDQLDDTIKEDRKNSHNYTNFYVSQAVWTPDEKAIAFYTLNPVDRRPSLFHWTAYQYKSNGAFDNWLKTVNTCKTRFACCSKIPGLYNIIMRDFPTPEFSSSVVNKNFVPTNSNSDEFQCEQMYATDHIENLRKSAENARRAAIEAKHAIKVIKMNNHFRILTYFKRTQKMKLLEFKPKTLPEKQV